MGLLTPPNTVAGVFKCIDADGSVTYSQSACEPEQETSKILEISSDTAPRQDCRVSERFASSVAERMKDGENSNQVFRHYGGIDSLNPSTVSLINYVFSHKNNDAASISRITALTTTRCEVGSFGISDCDTLPYEFIAGLGGCEAAKNGGSPAASNVAVPRPQSSSSVKTNSRSPEPPRSELNETNFDALQSADCKTRLTAELKQIYKDMRTSRSAAEQSELNDRRNELRRELGYCK